MAERSHAELDRAYRRTAFHVDFPEGRLTIRVGRRHPELDRQMPHHSGWSFVTAFNPGSEALAEADNDRRQSALEQVARALGARVIPGWGCGEGDWPPERSCLISGLDDETCCRLGRLFGQHAVVLGETGGHARLRWLGHRSAHNQLGGARRAPLPVLQGPDAMR